MEKKPNNVISLKAMQEQSEKNLKQAQETWKNLPQSWRAGAKPTAAKLGQTETKYKKLQEIRFC